MPFASFYVTKPGNRNDGPAIGVHCTDDEDAMAKAEVMLRGQIPGWTIEIWDETRFVGQARTEAGPVSDPAPRLKQRRKSSKSSANAVPGHVSGAQIEGH